VSHVRELVSVKNNRVVFICFSFFIGSPMASQLCSPNGGSSEGTKDERQGEKRGQKELKLALLLKSVEAWPEPAPRKMLS